ncbi:LysR substrate-binding domain-containing protein [Xylanimonas ulmi]|uniref:LysR substrate binding domain-containing protein n=1 Tax=Xylanimonas ulmi TaxID=228973 RepID=A0A4Q7M0K6_9MICO|nr:LysR substrate-binding domain-containing protein [Xylanibacterium ulmi]RZS59868.1 LysR substrate binding domain-containing protein [Xylanibacterium ulmi]
MSEQPVETFRLGYVPGATPGKWARTWRERLPGVRLDLVQVEAADAVAALERGEVDAAIARLPVDKTRLSAIALYEEVPVIVVSRDHLLAASGDDEAVTPADLADDVVHLADDDVLFAPGAPVPGLRPAAYREDGTLDPGGLAPRPTTTAEAVAWVAAGAGVTIVPMSLARLHHRKDVTHRVLDGGPSAPVGLVWVSERTTDLVDELIGIVRGRTVNSSRGRGGARRDEDGTGGRDGRDGRRGAGRGGQGRGAGGQGRGAGGQPGRAGAGKGSSGGAERGSARGSGPGAGRGKGRPGSTGKGRRGR